MSSVANVTDGKLVNPASTTESAKTNNSALDKDAFLQLLVAQMKYQDPLEPTSNTEYISQYATFSQVEQLQNMASTMNSSSAMQLVGKYVTVDVVSDNGVNSTVSGRVDYVERNGSNTYLYIDGVPYNYDNLNTVWDDDYLEAFELCETWAKAVNALPAADKLDISYADSIAKLREQYDSMTSYQKSFIGKTLLQILEEAEKKIQELQKAQETEKSEDDSAEDEDKKEDTSDVKPSDIVEDGEV